MALRRIDADVVHTVGAIVPNQVDVASIHFCHAGFVSATGRLASRDAPLLRRINTTLSRSMALLAERWSYRPSRLRSFAAVSEGVAGELARHYPTVPSTVTPNGVALSRFHPDAEAGAALRSELGTPDTTTVALFVGGDWHHKGLETAIAATATSRQSGQEVELWVVGNGDRTRFAKFADEWAVAPHIRFFGVRDDTERFYQAAALFVLPSAYETFSLVCFEAAACGLPLVIPPISVASEIIGSNVGGLLVERTVDSVAAAINRLAADPALRCSLGTEAQHRVKSYTWERSAACVIDLYRRLSGPG